MAIKKLTVNDPETRSPDLVAENLAQLKALFPELVTEGKAGASVNVDVLKALVGDKTVTDAEEKYGLNWHGKRQARQLALTPSTGTLRPCPEESVDWDTTQNLMIEGDNLEVLKLLQKSYAGKVKLIYIDPPYNTGHDFVYPDNFQDNITNYLELTGQTDAGGQRISSNTDSSGRFHTDWLNMIYPRLKLARSLLSDDGIICVSIGDSELSRLRNICDEVFGEEGFRGQISRSTGTPTGQGTERLINELDYIVIYAKSLETGFAGEVMDESDGAIYNQTDDKGKYLTRPLRKTGGEDKQSDRPTMYYAVEDPDGNNVYPVGPGGYKSRWRCGRQRYDELVEQGLIEWKKSDKTDGSNQTWKPYQKFYLDGRLKSPSNLWTDGDGNKKATRELSDLFGDRVFDYPKPVDLLKRIIAITGSGSDASIVLDFFAGSGTFGHAVMALNSTDSGNRRFILVQLPEPVDPANKDQKSAASLCDKLKKPRNISELTKERLRRAGKSIRKEMPLFKGDIGFRVFKLASSNIQAWEPNPGKLGDTLEAHVEHLKTDRTEDDILFELLLKLGLDLTVAIEEKTIAGKKVQSVGAGTLLVCLAPKISRKDAEPLALGMAAWHKVLAPAGECTVVFKDSAFADDVAKTNLAAILEQHGLGNVRSL